MLDDVKLSLRISNTAYDNEINNLIEAAIIDLTLAGIDPSKINDSDKLIVTAITFYCKSNFGFGNPDAERFQKTYDLLKMSLSLSGMYSIGSGC